MFTFVVENISFTCKYAVRSDFLSTVVFAVFGVGCFWKASSSRGWWWELRYHQQVSNRINCLSFATSVCDGEMVDVLLTSRFGSSSFLRVAHPSLSRFEALQVYSEPNTCNRPHHADFPCLPSSTAQPGHMSATINTYEECKLLSYAVQEMK